MKLRMLAWMLSLTFLGMSACEEKTEEVTDEAAAEPDQPAEPVAEEAAPPAPGPAELCAALVEAAQGENLDKFKELATETSAESLADEAAQKALLGWWKGGLCGEAAVNGEAATVPVTVGEESREIPFAKAGEAWKCDFAGYFAKYPAQVAPGKGKKVRKGKKGRKRKGRRKKKG